MANVSIVVEDKVISVDGDGRVGEYTFPANLWAMQLNGNEGQAEWTDGPNTDITPDDVSQYVTMWEANAPEAAAEPTAQETINNDSLAYLKNTDWYVVRYAETGVSVPSDVTTARAAARSAIVV
tara:strand:+ start:2143 stop:2514 length:372 start_codon:yes stop_codon:yes gene_type:complete